jgi:hypothetical protein
MGSNADPLATVEACAGLAEAAVVVVDTDGCVAPCTGCTGADGAALDTAGGG